MGGSRTRDRRDNATDLRLHYNDHELAQLQDLVALHSSGDAEIDWQLLTDQFNSASGAGRVRSEAALKTKWRKMKHDNAAAPSTAAAAPAAATDQRSTSQTPQRQLLSSTATGRARPAPIRAIIVPATPEQQEIPDTNQNQLLHNRGLTNPQIGLLGQADQYLMSGGLGYASSSLGMDPYQASPGLPNSFHEFQMQENQLLTSQVLRGPLVDLGLARNEEAPNIVAPIPYRPQTIPILHHSPPEFVNPAEVYNQAPLVPLIPVCWPSEQVQRVRSSAQWRRRQAGSQN